MSLVLYLACGKVRESTLAQLMAEHRKAPYLAAGNLITVATVDHRERQGSKGDCPAVIGDSSGCREVEHLY
jgi:hypothetical protein